MSARRMVWFFLAGIVYFPSCLSLLTIALPMISRRSVQEWKSCAASELKR